MWETVWAARIPILAMVFFAIGFCTLLLHRNLIKKIIGLNIMDTASYLLLTSFGYIEGGISPILSDAEEAVYVNPLPAGLVLTGIVVSVSVTALMLALTLRLYRRYHSLNVDEIYKIAMEEHVKRSIPAGDEGGKQ